MSFRALYCLLLALLASGLPSSASAQGSGSYAGLSGRGDQIVATVGPEVVLASEISGQVEMLLKQNQGEITPDQMDEVREYLTKAAIKSVVQRKLVLVGIRRQIPAEGLPQITKSFDEFFEKSEVKRLMEGFRVKTRAELDQKMREQGSSLAQYKSEWMESTFVSEWLKSKDKEEIQVTHEQMLQYYLEHSEKYDLAAKVRWEQLTVLFKPERGRQEALELLAFMGNKVLAGAPLPDIARQYSEEPLADEGGQHDWTAQGSLASEALDRALFTQPVGQLSPIIQDSQGVHIVRILERQAAGRRPFGEVQEEIKKAIQAEVRAKNKKKTIDELTAGTTVWTIFDGPRPDLAPLSTPAANQAPQNARLPGSPLFLPR